MTKFLNISEGCSFCHKCGSRISRRAYPTWSKRQGRGWEDRHSCDIDREHIHWHCDCGYEWAEEPVVADDR